MNITDSSSISTNFHIYFLHNGRDVKALALRSYFVGLALASKALALALDVVA